MEVIMNVIVKKLFFFSLLTVCLQTTFFSMNAMDNASGDSKREVAQEPKTPKDRNAILRETAQLRKHGRSSTAGKAPGTENLRSLPSPDSKIAAAAPTLTDGEKRIIGFYEEKGKKDAPPAEPVVSDAKRESKDPQDTKKPDSLDEKSLSTSLSAHDIMMKKILDRQTIDAASTLDALDDLITLKQNARVARYRIIQKQFLIVIVVVGCVALFIIDPKSFVMLAYIAIIVVQTMPQLAGAMGSDAYQIEVPKKSLKDLSGLPQGVLDELGALMYRMKNPSRFKRLGIKEPHGILLEGPPGTGKTQIAEAFATATGATFIRSSASKFVAMYVGKGAMNVRALFEQARGSTPCILFMDEFDAVGARNSRNGHAEIDQTITELLTQLDPKRNTGIIIFLATNDASKIDPALRRDGRIDRVLTMNNPNEQGRKEILQGYIKNIPNLAPDISPEFIATLAKTTPMFSGASLENLVKTAQTLAADEFRPHVTRDDFLKAYDTVYNNRLLEEPSEPGDYRFKPEHSLVTLANVAGMSRENLKAIMENVISPIKKSARFAMLRAEPSCGLLLYGPPGTGKTLIAKAIAGELGHIFFYVPPTALKSSFAGKSADNIRRLFKAARQCPPAIICFDEIDSVGTSRKKSIMPDPEQRATLTQLLTELGDTAKNSGIFCVATTNSEVSELDEALVRAGRFDTKLTIGLPDIKGRAEILLLYSKKLDCSPEVNPAFINTIASRTDGLSGADLENLVKTAARNAALDEKSPDKIQPLHFNKALLEVTHTKTTPKTGIHRL